MNEKSTLVDRLESLGRLLLLGKFIAVEDVFEAILQDADLPEDKAKQLDFLLRGYILHLLTNERDSGELKILFKAWTRLMAKNLSGDEQGLKRRFLEFLVFYIKLAGKDKTFLDVVQKIMANLAEEGVEISHIAPVILEAVKNPRSRKAQKWMADPLFKEVVGMLSK